MKLSEWQNECRMIGNRVTCIDADTGIKNSGLYMKSSGYFCGSTYVNNYPMYYVWISDVLVKTTSNYTEAYNFWANRSTVIMQSFTPVPMVG